MKIREAIEEVFSYAELLIVARPPSKLNPERQQYVITGLTCPKCGEVMKINPRSNERVPLEDGYSRACGGCGARLYRKGSVIKCVG